jgi:hypothetical protein
MMSATSATSSTNTHDQELGPIDIVVIAYPPGSPMSGEAAPMLLDLVERGIIRVLDVLFVTKADDGSVAGFEASGLDDKAIGDFKVFEGASSGLLGDEDARTAAEALEPGMSAVIIVYENRWAAPFAAAVRRNGGVLVDFQRIPVDAVVETLDALEASS